MCQLFLCHLLTIVMTNCVHIDLEAVQTWDTWTTGILPCVFAA